MLKSFFDKLPIRQKLFVMHLQVTGAALFAVFILLVAYQYYSFRHQLMSELNSQMLVVQGNLGAAIAFEDPKAAVETLESFALNDSVDRVYIELENHQIFAEYLTRDRKNSRSLVPINRTQISPIHLSTPVMVNHQPIATLHLDANLEQINSKVRVFIFAVLLAVLIAALIARQITRGLNQHITDPIAYLQKLVTSMSESQDFSRRSRINTEDEIGALSDGINKMLDGIKLRDSKLNEELEQRKEVEKKLDQLAYFDHQTTLPNRHAFTEQLLALMAACSQSEGFYLLLLDLDNFKIVNDTLGHHGGDQLLKDCSERLRSILSKMDGLYRIGGDEFAIILQNVKNVVHVEKICSRIIRTVSQTFLVDGHEVAVGVSVGAVEYINKNYDENNLVKNADIAMYWAKSDGKNTYKIYSKEIEESRFHQQKLISDLQSAQKNQELKIFYQPIVSVESGKIIGFEALIRWIHPEFGNISPDLFIPIAENTGMITTIGDWVLNGAIAQLSDWQKKYSPELTMNINISGKQFQDMSIINKVTDLIQKYQIQVSNTIKLELTESILMEDVNKTVHILSALKGVGVGIAVDDFGTGHSSMSYLKQFPVNTLKIDKSFVKGLPHDKVDVAIAEAIFALARSLKLVVVAEGVETEEQFEFLRRHKCKKAQGYLFSRPVPAAEIERLFDEFHFVLEHQPQSN